MPRKELTLPLKLSVLSSQTLRTEYKQKLIQCLDFLANQPEMADTLFNQPHNLKFQLNDDIIFNAQTEEASQYTDFNVEKNIISVDKFYFANATVEDLALKMAKELCHSNQVMRNISYISNKLFFEETFFIAKLGDLEANLKTAQISARLKRNNPLGKIYDTLLKTNTSIDASTEMAKILWNGLLPEELAGFKSFMKEQTFIDNMNAYRKAYQIHGLVDCPLTQKGTRQPDEIYMDYICSLNLNITPDWFSEGENLNVLVAPHYYITKDIETDTVKSFTMASFLNPEFISVLEVHPQDYMEPTAQFIYHNGAHLGKLEEVSSDQIVYTLFKNHTLAKSAQKEGYLSAEELNKITMGTYLICAAINDTLDDVKKILEKCPQAIDFQDFRGETPLSGAIQTENEHKNEIIPYLLSKNPDLLNPLPDGKSLLSLLPELKNISLRKEITRLYNAQLKKKYAMPFNHTGLNIAQNQRG